jgi:uncharacterized membrane protein
LAASSEISERICPGCGGRNEAGAVFCANPECHKALGDFKYVLEELRAATRWHERLADRVTGFIGRPQFLGLHAFWFTAWIVLNSGLIAMWRFDNYPFSLLGIVLSMETIFITGFVLISQNRESKADTKQAELDYEVNVLTYRKIHEIDARLAEVLARLERLETAPATVDSMTWSPSEGDSSVDNHP